jgi:uncharacterized repeat protein (TIGR01451 family)
MIVTVFSRPQLLIAAACLALLPGCFGVTQNPTYFPHLLPTGDIFPTHAKPPGLGYFKDFDPHACRLEVRPLEATSAVGTQHVLVATIYDENGTPRRHRRIEWLVEGAGNIVEVDEGGFFPGRGYKVDNKYAVSYTGYGEHTFDRGNLDPNDDFTVRPGQSWCVISSAVEGDTHVTVYAPEVFNWDNRKTVVTHHWVDAEWRFPPPVVGHAGADQLLATQVTRRTDHQPLSDYQVRYRVLDGPPAVFLPTRLPEQLATTDIGGSGAVLLAQTETRPGVSRIGIEIIRPRDPNVPSGAGIVVGRGETRVDWQAPQISVNTSAPPAAPVGQEVSFTLTVSNTGQLETKEITLRDALPDGMTYVRSDPPATVDGNQLIWTLTALPGGQTHSIQLVCRPGRAGPVTQRAVATTGDGLRAENNASTQITLPQLTVKIDGPAAGFVGVPVAYTLTVTNPGTGPATNVVLSDDFDGGLEHETRSNPVKKTIGTLAPGESKTEKLLLTPRQVGRLFNRVTATADGELTAHSEHPIDANKGQLKIDMTGPSLRFLNRPAGYAIRVSNTGEVPLDNLIVRDQLPPELTFTNAGQGGTLVNTEVVWQLGTLKAGEQKTLDLTVSCTKPTPKSLNVAVATADPGLTVQTESVIEINGLPAFRLEVQDLKDPIEVGGTTRYQIDATNQGTLPGTRVEIRAVVPAELKVIQAQGPTAYRIEGNQLIFAPVDSLAPGQRLTYAVDVQALRVGKSPGAVPDAQANPKGDVRFRVELRSATLQDPVVEEESTTITAPAAAPAPVPGAPR